MEIDLFTWGAQIVNFLILVALLRHFLYGRIVHAIDTRQEKIASRWDDAEREKQRATERIREYEQKRDEIEAERQKILAEAKTEAEARKDEMTKQARMEVDAVRSQWHKAMQQDKQSFLDDLRQAAASQVANALRHVLRELADADLQGQTVHRFLEQLDGAQGQRVKDLVAATGPLTVKTSFELTEEQQGRIRDRVQETADRDVDLEFATSPDLICGIELRGDGRKIAWSVQAYLDELDKNVGQRLERRRWGKAEEESESSDEDDAQEEERQEQPQHAE